MPDTFSIDEIDLPPPSASAASSVSGPSGAPSSSPTAATVFSIDDVDTPVPSATGTTPDAGAGYTNAETGQPFTPMDQPSAGTGSDIANAAVQGAGGAVGATLQGAAALNAAVGGEIGRGGVDPVSGRPFALPEPNAPLPDPRTSPLYRAGADVTATTQQAFPVQNENFGTELARTAGAIPVYLGAGAIGGVPAAALAGGLSLAGSATAAAPASATPEELGHQALGDFVIGAAGTAIPVESVFYPILRATPGLVDSAIAAFKNAVRSGAVGATAQAAQRFAANFVAQQTTNPNQDLIEGVPTAAATGGMVFGAAGAARGATSAIPEPVLPPRVDLGGGPGPIIENEPRGPGGGGPAAGPVPAPGVGPAIPETAAGPSPASVTPGGRTGPRLLPGTTEPGAGFTPQPGQRIEVTFPSDGSRATGVYQGRDGADETIAFDNTEANPESLRGKVISGPASRYFIMRAADQPIAPAARAPAPSLQQILEDERPLSAIQGEHQQRVTTADRGTPLPESPPGSAANPVAVSTAADLHALTSEIEHEPSPAQKLAGNYSMGHAIWRGLPITIETAQGRQRTATDGSWSVTMPAHYGYIRSTTASDGEGVDVLFGNQPKSDQVFVIDQINPATGAYDEAKVLAGFPGRQQAISAYTRSFSDGSGPSRIGAVTPMTVERLKAWLANGDTRAPLAYVVPPEPAALPTPASSGGTPQPGAPPASVLPAAPEGAPDPVATKIQQITQGAARGQYRAQVLEGPHRGIVGLGNTPRNAHMDAMRQIAERGTVPQALNEPVAPANASGLQETPSQVKPGAAAASPTKAPENIPENIPESRARQTAEPAVEAAAKKFGVNLSPDEVAAAVKRVEGGEDPWIAMQRVVGETAVKIDARADAVARKEGRDDWDASGTGTERTGAAPANGPSGPPAHEGQRTAGARPAVPSQHEAHRSQPRETRARHQQQQQRQRSGPGTVEEPRATDLHGRGPDSAPRNTRSAEAAHGREPVAEPPRRAVGAAVTPPPPRVPVIEIENGDIRAAVDRLVAIARGPGHAPTTLRMGPVPPAAAALAASHGVDLGGFQLIMQASDVRHALNRHGGNAQLRRGELPVTAEDLARVPEIIATADRLARSETDQHLPALIFTKREGDTTVVVEEVRAGRHHLAFKAMRKFKRGGGPGAMDAPEGTPDPTSETLAGSATGNVATTGASVETAAPDPERLRRLKRVIDKRRNQPLAVPALSARLGATAADVRRALDYIAGRGEGIRKTPNGMYRRVADHGPLDMLQFIASQGGIRDHAGELRAREAQRFIPGFGQIVRQNGHPFDEMTRRLWEAGYLGPNGEGSERPDINTMFEALDRALAGKKIYSDQDEREIGTRAAESQRQAEAHRLREVREEIGARAADDGVTLTPEEIDEAVRLVAAGADARSALDEVVERGAIADAGEEGQDAIRENDDTAPPFEPSPARETRTDAGSASGPVSEPDRGAAREQAPIGRESPGAEPGRARKEPQGGGAPATEPAEAGEQGIIPGAEHETPEQVAARERKRQREEAEARMRGPARPKTAQENPDTSPLFGGKGTQGDIPGLSDATPIFYSALTRAVEDVRQPKAPPAQWKAIIRNAASKGVKQEEIDWSGVNDWLDQQQGAVTKEALVGFLRANEIAIAEVQRGGGDADRQGALDEIEDWARANLSEFAAQTVEATTPALEHGPDVASIERLATVGVPRNLLNPLDEPDKPLRYASYALPGGANYRELLLTLPDAAAERKTHLEEIQQVRDLTPNEVAEHKSLIGRAKEYHSPHFDEPNVVAHIRLDDRTDGDGKRALFVEEVQSDWHQRGRRSGYIGTGTPEQRALVAERDRLAGEVADIEEAAQVRGYRRSSVEDPERLPRLERISEINAELERAGGEGPAAVPNAPFKTTWPELAMKRVLRYAAENGYDRIAWTTGAQQAERYDLSKRIREVRLDDNTSGGVGAPKMEGAFREGMLIAYDFEGHRVIEKYVRGADEVADALGKEVAERLLASAPKSVREAGLGIRRRALTDLDLKVGGEGMAAFYDRMLPAFLNRYTKKWGAKVGETVIDLGSESQAGWESVGTSTQAGAGPQKVHALDITPAMRAGVMEGQPLFDARRYPNPSPTSRPFRDEMSEARAGLGARRDALAMRRYLLGQQDDDGFEHIVAIQDGGIAASGTSEIKDWVAVPPSLSDAIRIDGARVSLHHNHPSGNPLSAGDLFVLAYPGIGRIASYDGGSFSVALTEAAQRWLGKLHGDDIDARVATFAKLVTGAFDGALGGMLGAVVSGTIGNADANFIHLHALGRALAAAGLVDYHSRPNDADSRTNHPLHALALRRALEDVRSLINGDPEFQALRNLSDRSAAGVRVAERDRGLSRPGEPAAAGLAGSEGGDEARQASARQKPDAGLSDFQNPFTRMALDQAMRDPAFMSQLAGRDRAAMFALDDGENPLLSNDYPRLNELARMYVAEAENPVVSVRDLQQEMSRYDEAVLRQKAANRGREGLSEEAPFSVRLRQRRFPLEQSIRRARDLMDEAAHGFQLQFTPMAVGKGERADQARAIAKDYMNADRLARYRWAQLDRRLERQYTPAERELMGRALEEQSVYAMRGERAPDGRGLNRLDERMRREVNDLDKLSAYLWGRAIDVGLVRDERVRVPYYFPRSAIRLTQNGAEQIGGGAGEAGRDIDALGVNFRTTSSHLKRREHETPEETEAALRAKFGEDVALVKDIRALPLALAEFERAIAGRALIEEIKRVGREAGEEWVSDSYHDGWFTVPGHRAFYTWRPKFTTDPETGKAAAVVDDDGDTVFEQVPIHIHPDFRGPLLAVLTKPSPSWYRHLMALKSRVTMGIMFTPLSHNLVELGRSFPVMPGQFIGLRLAGGWFPIPSFARVYRVGYRVRQDGAWMEDAIAHGLVPMSLGRGHVQDITDVAEAPLIEPGRGWVAKGARAALTPIDQEAALSAARAIDAFGDLWHRTLLWDRIADLQAGIAKYIYDEATREGLPHDVAMRVAAHIGNRYAGSLPMESMSQFARMFLNIALFSRSFTVGNWGQLKDAITGLPRDVQAQIRRDWQRLTFVAEHAGGSGGGGEEPPSAGAAPAAAEPPRRSGPISEAGEEEAERAAQFARRYARRKALATFLRDIAFYFISSALLQNFFGDYRGDTKTWGEIAEGYMRRLRNLFLRGVADPLSVLNPLDDIRALLPMSENEPGKQDRVYVGRAKDGTAIYLLNPFGRVPLDLLDTILAPLDLLKRKLSTFARPMLDIVSNQDAFGRPVYDSDAPPGLFGDAKAVGQAVWHILKAQIPFEQLISSAGDLLSDTADQGVAEIKALGAIFGLSFSKGYPGGPAAGDAAGLARRLQDAREEARPEIRDMVRRGDIEGAQQRLTELGYTTREANEQIRFLGRAPSGVSRSRQQLMDRAATPEELERFRVHEQETAPSAQPQGPQQSGSSPQTSGAPAMPKLGPMPGELHLDPAIAPHVPQGAPRPLAPGEYVQNPDGGWSSEISVTVENPALNSGKPTVVPSLWLIGGKPTRVSEDEAAQFAARSGLAFRSFTTEDDADRYSQQREDTWQRVGRAGARGVAPLWSTSVPP